MGGRRWWGAVATVAVLAWPAAADDMVPATAAPRW